MAIKRSGCLWVALLLVLGFSLFLNVGLVYWSRSTDTEGTSFLTSPSNEPQRFSERLILGGAGSEERIVVIPIRGLISYSVSGMAGTSMVDDIKLQLRQAESDSRIKAVILAIDSPGGEVTASDNLYNAVRRLRTKKKVIVSMGSMATSGGYYVACGGSHLMANKTSFTGSIGVIIQSLRYNELLQKIGVEQLTFKSGAFKDMLSGAREMTREEKDYIQKLVMQTYDIFLNVVASERRLEAGQLRNGVADGRVLSGTDALEAGLIDEIGELEDAYRKARELAKAPNAAIVSYQTQFSLSRLLQLFSSEESAGRIARGKVEVNLTQKLLPPLEPGRAYWLPGVYAL